MHLPSKDLSLRRVYELKCASAAAAPVTKPMQLTVEEIDDEDLLVPDLGRSWAAHRTEAHPISHPRKLTRRNCSLPWQAQVAGLPRGLRLPRHPAPQALGLPLPRYPGSHLSSKLLRTEPRTAARSRRSTVLPSLSRHHGRQSARLCHYHHQGVRMG